MTENTKKGFQIIVNDHYCVYKYDVGIPGDVSIYDVVRAVCEKFNCNIPTGTYCGNPEITQHVTLDDSTETKINKAKNFINILSTMQDHCYERLVQDLAFNDKGDDMLYDYVYNSGEDGLYLNFKEWLSYYKYDIEDCLSK